MAREISNSDDVIDSRDVIARIEELEGELADIIEAMEDSDYGGDGTRAEWEAENGEELAALKALAEDAEGYAPDWHYGATLIRDSYFVDYVQELVYDIGDMPREIPSYIEIDWNATADNVRVDYTEVDFDGVTYWIR